MALFKISRGLSVNLPEEKTEGWCWYTVDDSMFYIDYKDDAGNLKRKPLNAAEAQQSSTLIDQNSGVLMKIWRGTAEEYKAIAHPDPTTIYFLSDTVGEEAMAIDIRFDNSDTAISADNIQEALIELSSTKQPLITGSQGQFVVIGDDGNATTISLNIAEEVSY